MPRCSEPVTRRLLIKRLATIRTVIFLPAALLLCLPHLVHALPETELAASFDTQVWPFFSQEFQQGTFQGKDGRNLRYATRDVPNMQGYLLIVSGRTEFLAKYAELLYDLRALPMSMYLFDLRGQGQSARLLSDHHKGHITHFEDYVDDLGIFIDTVVKPDQKSPLFLLSHSMGGVVSALYANSHPSRVQGMILSSPMLAINTWPLPVTVARLLADAACRLGFDDAYVPGGEPYNPAKPFADNDVTHSQTRFTLNQRLVTDNPANALGSPTYGWIRGAYAAMDRLHADHNNLKMPILLLQAGADTVVRNDPQTALCTTLADCTVKVIPEARHEILMEEDQARNLAIASIESFVRQYLPAHPSSTSGDRGHE